MPAENPDPLAPATPLKADTAAPASGASPNRDLDLVGEQAGEEAEDADDHSLAGIGNAVTGRHRRQARGGRFSPPQRPPDHRPNGGWCDAAPGIHRL